MHYYYTVKQSIRTYIIFVFTLMLSTLYAQDTTLQSLPYPIKEPEGDFLNDPNSNPFYLKNPDVIEQNVEYDSETNQYIITETVNGRNIKPPTYMTFEEYMQYTLKEENESFWKSKENTERMLGNKNILLPFNPRYNPNKAGGLFRGLVIDFQPQGNVEMTLAGNIQKNANPYIPRRSQRYGGFDFDMNINLSLTGKIGDALAMTIKYNNQTGFSFDNQVKLQYKGKEDQIIQLIEAGNVSFPLQTQLITGLQSLRGVKTQFRFGKMTITSVLSQQLSQKQSIVIEDGAQTQNFEIKADQYESDKHFFLAQFFKDNYNQSLENIPNIVSLYNIEEIEVWVTNRTGQTSNVRDVVAFMDLGEKNPYSPDVHTMAGSSVPDNHSNDLYNRISSDPNFRLSNTIVNSIQTNYPSFEGVADYEKTYARLLSPSEYVLNNELGFISLRTALQPNQVLGVAFKYTYNGQVYQVGELSRNVPPDSSSVTKTLFLKMLRSSAIRPDLPLWDLMMKNIYSLGAYQISPDDFKLDIFYIDPGGGQKRFLPNSNLSKDQIIRVLNLDRLNNQGDPQPDGVFDFQPGITIEPQNGRLIFPVTEPFGSFLEQKLIDAGNADLVDVYPFTELYDSTVFLAQQYPEKNRFLIKGKYKGNAGNRISLGAFQLPEGSVKVSLGGIQLVEGQDYEVDYNSGVVTIINEGLLSSGQQIKIDYENNALFNFQQRSLMAARLDYRVADNFFLGGTIMKMKERPFSQKVNLGNDPINNTIMGLDFKANADLPFLTKFLDKLPIYSTNEMSNITVQGEVAHLRPGHNKFVELEKEPTVYIEDFEGSTGSYDLKGNSQTWRLASTPKNAKDKSGNILFPEADLSNNVNYGINRAKLTWYGIDNSFFQKNFSPEAVFDDKENTTNHYVRPIFQNELYPNKVNAFPIQQYTFDLSYYPDQRGQYNYEWSNNGNAPYSKGVNTNGKLLSPKTRWGGIMRGVQNNNFEVANIEYLEFWLLDPFIEKDNSKGGQLYFNLGNVSEDILKDSRMQWEHGISEYPSEMDSTIWGQVPIDQPIVNQFSNDETLRDRQDVGFDGLTDEEERDRFFDFISNVQVDPQAKQILESDPSSDNYTHYLDPSIESNPSIINRYKNYNNPSGNSPVIQGSTVLAGTNKPDQEDVNGDNSLSEVEQYYQYIVDLYPGMNTDNHPFIVSQTEYEGREIDGFYQPDWTWYQFRIPIYDYNQKIGNIQDFRSIQYLRMFMHNWEDSITLRFGTLEFIRNQWRTYQYELRDASDNIPIDEDGTFLNVSQVNIEENGSKEPVNYVLPPGINREQGIAQNGNTLVPLNEQALSVNVCNLKDGDARAIYKNIEFDFRNYERLIMDIHANRMAGELMPEDGSVTAFIRTGIDFKDNYYQIETPLQFTPDGSYDDNETDRDIVWPVSNKIEVSLNDLVQAKVERNAIGWPTNVPYTTKVGNKLVTIKGIPDLGSVQILMLGVRNPSVSDLNNPLPEDNGEAVCAEVWFNELRLAGFDEKPGTAAMAAVTLKLADLGNVNFNTSMHGVGYGQVDMAVDERFQDTYFQYDVNANLQLGKFLPAKANFMIPFYGGISQTFSKPEYDPYQYDIKTKDQIKSLQTINKDSANSYKKQIQNIVTRRGFNFMNVRKLPGEKQKRLYFFSIENIGLSYAYNEIKKSDPFIESDFEKNHMARFDYVHTLQPKYLYPFKKLFKGPSKGAQILKDINFNFFPSTMAFNTQMDRKYGELNLRTLEDDGFVLPATYNKFFTWERNYLFKYNPFKSLSLEYSANNSSRIDEPFGRLSKEDKKGLWKEIGRGGRNTMFSQSASATYTLPLNKIPYLEFINGNVSYASNYNWIAAPLRANVNGEFIQNSLGHTINNSQQIQLNGDLNMDKFYAKFPYLKKFTGSNPTAGNKKATQSKKASVKSAREKITDQIESSKEEKIKAKEELLNIKKDEELERKERKEKIKTAKKNLKEIKKRLRKFKTSKREKQLPATFVENFFIQPLLSVKNVSASFSETRSTQLPGYMQDTDFFGTDRQNKNAPGYDFVFGAQPGFQWFKKFDSNKRDEWLQRAAAKKWISTDTLQNQKFTQVYNQTMNFGLTIEPWRDLQIDMTLMRSYTENHTQFFKKLSPNDNFEHHLPANLGTFEISTITWKTMFNKYDDKWFSKTYNTYLDNREVISKRLQEKNQNSQGVYVNPSDTVSPINPNYAQGYGPASQDVLIPAFLAAYQGKDPKKVKLNPFSTLPKPNWKISYNGLTKFKWAQKVFSNFSIRHGYQSSISIGSYQTNYDYEGTGNYLAPTKIDTLNGNFYTLYNMPNIIINEQLNPLIGFDFTFKNGVQARIDYKKSRIATVNLTDFQLIENKSTTITAGLGYRIKGLKMPFKVKGKKVILHNDLNMRFDFSYRDNVVVNHQLDQGNPEPSSGSTVITVSPSIDYVISKQLNIRIFLDRNRTIPKTSASYSTTSTRFGVTFRFSLANL